MTKCYLYVNYIIPVSLFVSMRHPDLARSAEIYRSYLTEAIFRIGSWSSRVPRRAETRSQGQETVPPGCLESICHWCIINICSILPCLAISTNQKARNIRIIKKAGWGGGRGREDKGLQSSLQFFKTNKTCKQSSSSNAQTGELDERTSKVKGISI